MTFILTVMTALLVFAVIRAVIFWFRRVGEKESYEHFEDSLRDEPLDSLTERVSHYEYTITVPYWVQQLAYSLGCSVGTSRWSETRSIDRIDN